MSMFSPYLLLMRDCALGERLGVELAIVVETALSLLWRGIFVVGDSLCGRFVANRVNQCPFVSTQQSCSQLSSQDPSLAKPNTTESKAKAMSTLSNFIL